jgi:hypothetical protein
MSTDAVRVTPAELAGVADQVRALAAAAHSRSVELRSAVAGVGPPDPTADETLVREARATQVALEDVSELLRSLLLDLGRALDVQAAALTGAAQGYAYVEQQVGATFLTGERPHE